MALLFHKYEGLGNDFIVVRAALEADVSPGLARALCDRRFGVGADGVLLVLPASAGGHARMRVINADGSIPEMCGNGLRCAALDVARSQRCELGELTFETDAGLRPCLIDDRDGRGLVTIDMGKVRVSDEIRFELEGDSWPFVIADAGNPHAITTRAATRAVMDVVGPRVAVHSHFPAGTNVEFASFRDDGRVVDLVVWERGVGITMACGTGACATVAVGVAQGLVAPGVEVDVALPGGVLHVMIRGDGHAIMRGPARHVFSGSTVNVPKRPLTADTSP